MTTIMDKAWNDLCEMADRASPADYPNHCLITKDELTEFMKRARDLSTEGCALLIEAAGFDCEGQCAKLIRTLLPSTEGLTDEETVEGVRKLLNVEDATTQEC